MRILVEETEDKTSRSYIDVEPALLLKMIETDYGLHEVINMFDPNIQVRLFFDIDATNYPTVLEETLECLNSFYKTTYEDWAITCGNYQEVYSYHIYSKKYCTSLKQLRLDVKTINCTHIDDGVYSFSLFSNRDEGYMRLPNQTKFSINKFSGIHKLIQGELKDCLITIIDGLTSIV